MPVPVPVPVRTGTCTCTGASRHLHLQKTADFGNQESVSGGRFRLGSVLSTVPDCPPSGAQRRPYFRRPSRVVVLCSPLARSLQTLSGTGALSVARPAPEKAAFASVYAARTLYY